MSDLAEEEQVVRAYDQWANPRPNTPAEEAFGWVLFIIRAVLALGILACLVQLVTRGL